MELLDALTLADTGFLRCADTIGADGWDRPTPCAEWTVRELVRHVRTGATAVATATDPAPAAAGHDREAAPLERLRLALGAQEEAFARLDSLDKDVQLGSWTMRAKSLVLIRISESLIHSWDLARALDADESLEPSLVEVVWRFQSKSSERLAKSRHFGGGPSGSDTAGLPLQERLLDLCGRRA